MVELLEDCPVSLARRAIDFFFVSTHSLALHLRTVALLEQAGYRVEVLSDFERGTTSFDGFVFASSPAMAARFEGFAPLTREQIDGSDPQFLLDYANSVRRWALHAEPGPGHAT